MSFATANGDAIQRMTLVLPSRRAWYAKLEVDAASAPAEGGSVVIEIDGGTRLVGTALRPTVDGAGQVSMQVLGGAGRLTVELEPQNYTGSTVREVLTAIVADAGEKLSTTIDAAILTHPLSKWPRTRADGAHALSDLANEIGGTWRVLDDGTVWLGVDAGDAPAFDYDVADGGEKPGSVTVAIESAPLRPGQTFRGAPVVEVWYELTGSSFTAKVVQTEGGDAATRKIRKQVDAALAPTKLHPPTAAKVVSQNGDGTLELAIEVPPGKKPNVAPISRVPLRHGLPGVTKLEVAAGSRVALFFEGGDRKRPFAGLCLEGRTTKVVVDGDRFEWGGDDAVVQETPLMTWLTSQLVPWAAVVSAALGVGVGLPVVGVALPPPPTPPTDLGSSTLFAKTK